MSGKKDKGPGTRTCPLCAETLRADATKCRSCGSTLFAADLQAPTARAAVKGGDGGWPAPEPGDVGLAGAGAVLGGLVGHGLGAWALSGGALGAVVVLAAAAGWAVAGALARGPAQPAA